MVEIYNMDIKNSDGTFKRIYNPIDNEMGFTLP